MPGTGQELHGLGFHTPRGPQPPGRDAFEADNHAGLSFPDASEIQSLGTATHVSTHLCFSIIITPCSPDELTTSSDVRSVRRWS